MSIKINFKDRFLHHVADPGGRVKGAPRATPAQPATPAERPATPAKPGAPAPAVPKPAAPPPAAPKPPTTPTTPTQAEVGKQQAAWQQFVGIPTERPAPPTRPPTPPVKPAPAKPVTPPPTARPGAPTVQQLERDKNLFALMVQQAGPGVDPRVVRGLAARSAEAGDKIEDIRRDEVLRNVGETTGSASYVMESKAPVFSKLPEAARNKIVTNLTSDKPNEKLTKMVRVVQFHEQNPDAKRMRGRPFTPVYKALESMGTDAKGLLNGKVKINDLLKAMRDAEQGEEQGTTPVTAT